ncbi:DUF3298 and DUF4163 domain-containing protein [Mucilaginibacter myungsuensis]
MLSTGCLWEAQKKSEPDITSDTLHYQYTTFKHRAPDCGDKADSNCTVISIEYPVFEGQPTLNDTIRHRAATLFTVNNTPDTNLNAFAEKFIKAYQTDMVNRNSKISYTLETKLIVTRQDSALLTTTLSGYSFQGGAHGSSLTMFINWDTEAKRYIALTDLLTDGANKGLDSVAQSIFRKQEKLTPTQSLKDNYFFTNDVFALPDNFMITPTGLRFLYNEYEIKPYAAGQTELFIPYDQIKPLLKPNTVVSQYIH